MTYSDAQILCVCVGGGGGGVEDAFSPMDETLPIVGNVVLFIV